MSLHKWPPPPASVERSELRRENRRLRQERDELYRIARVALDHTDLIQRLTMTEREPSPSDIMTAITNVGATYHDIHLDLGSLRQELAASREERTRDFQRVLGALDMEKRAREQDIRLLDGRFDALARELDTLKQSLMPGDEIRQRLDKLEARVQALEDRS